ncbi:heavy metal-binding domain-containing protein [Sphingomonas sp. RB3P16]|uniref:heavy metal-binding domain-containing protein n=1 Tax=Parasphingomonas frigoris TaxID=3096163 RepID=UPI002FC89980
MTTPHQDALSPAQHAERFEAWEVALNAGGLPQFVTERLAGAAVGSGAWVATMTPAELLLARTHGVRPVATVSGTCWFHYGQSWTEGHAQGWHEALERIQREAVAAGANAVVDVRMRTLRHRIGASMDFTLIGTAVKIEGLAPSPHPVVATVPALEFVRLLEADIVPVGIAVGARFDWLGNPYGSGGDWTALSDISAKLSSFQSIPIMTLTNFWERIRRDAHADLRAKVAEQGNGVLAHTHFGQLIRRERDKQPAAYLGRHIVIGTVVDAKPGVGMPLPIEMVIDMRDVTSPLRNPGGSWHSAYQSDVMDEEGGI